MVATLDTMGWLEPLGKVLGPRSWMPSPRAGTVTAEVAWLSRNTRPVKSNSNIKYLNLYALKLEL